MQTANGKIEFLFLCIGNSCRSQMAEGRARRLKNHIIEPYPAAIETHGLYPNAVEVMAVSGVDSSGHRPTRLGELRHMAFNYVLTACDHPIESCPVIPGALRSWFRPFDDPAIAPGIKEARLAKFRDVRDHIRQIIQEWLPIVERCQ